MAERKVIVHKKGFKHLEREKRHLETEQKETSKAELIKGVQNWVSDFRLRQSAERRNALKLVTV